MANILDHECILDFDPNDPKYADDAQLFMVQITYSTNPVDIGLHCRLVVVVSPPPKESDI